MYYIYRITNKVNGKTYIGQHKYKDLNDNYKGSGKLLWGAYRKYGFENFEKEILYSRIQYKETVDDMERFAIAKERAIGKAEYNIADGGQGGNLVKGKTPWNKGTKFSEEHKRRISEALKGRHPSEETRRKMSEAQKGKHISEEQRKKHSEALRGKKRGTRSEVWKMHLSESLKGRTAWNKGKHWPEETRRKISESKKGKRISGEHKRKHWKLVDGKRVWY